VEKKTTNLDRLRSWRCQKGKISSCFSAAKEAPIADARIGNSNPGQTTGYNSNGNYSRQDLGKTDETESIKRRKLEDDRTVSFS